ncbi:hypothetical protein [Thalassorhabdomicrobium marinisediminis]|uniref:YMGG-like Gly-zipper domain-containing protein n=1 Tax=Thalassorhabdomicrobium marinisediminis TaxID=2170577 RepID=A0A2T7FWL0_9RHOB|nr:hypothetical protein [Thalassorhabdomicrobium marinisediminis]PVA06555.1 hypothetical protein DC363_08440 [Thalassorhabdomicrobium marinisediminis]
MLKFTKIAGLTLVAGLLAACDNDLERGVAGAAAGAVIADATGNDVATGAGVGALAGVFCDDAGVCRNR